MVADLGLNWWFLTNIYQQIIFFLIKNIVFNFFDSWAEK